MSIPLFEVNNQFTHNVTNGTLSVLSVSPTVGISGDFIYFVSLVNAKGEVSYTNVSESYLEHCILHEQAPVEVSDIPVEVTI